MKTNKKKILVVDDERAIVNLVKVYLQEEGYRVLVGYNGMEALEVVREKGPDLMILDLEMPILDGFEVIERLKKDKTISHIPIIILTAYNIKKYRDKCFQLGVDKFIAKPFQRELLIREINNIFNSEVANE